MYPFIRMQCDRIRGTRYKLLQRKFCEVRRRGGKKEEKKRIIKQWNKLPREVEDRPLLEMFRTWLDVDLGDLVYGSAFSRKVDKVNSTHPFSLAFSAIPQFFTLGPPRGMFYSIGGFPLLLPLFTVKCCYKPQVKSGSECGSPLFGRWFFVH